MPNSAVRLSTVVMAHPSRRAQAEQLCRRHPELQIDIVYDPDPEDKGSTLRTAIRAWSQVRSGATHHLVLQEDVQLCRDFRTIVLRALSMAPPGAVALFSNWTMATAQAVRLAAVAGASWTPVIDNWVPTQALVMAAAVARGFGDFAASYPGSKPDNRAIAEYLAARGLTTHVAIPNMVQHRPTQSVLLNDLLFGVRNATVFPDSAQIGPAFSERVVAPPAVAHLCLGDFTTLSNYERLGVGNEPPTMTPAHEVLMARGMRPSDLLAEFSRDRGRCPEDVVGGFSDSLLFQFWITMYVQGIIAREITSRADCDSFAAALDRSPWPRIALSTFAASAFRKMEPRQAIRRTAARLSPFCVASMGSGFVAADRWPELGALGRPAMSTAAAT